MHDIKLSLIIPFIHSHIVSKRGTVQLAVRSSPDYQLRLKEMATPSGLSLHDIMTKEKKKVFFFLYYICFCIVADYELYTDSEQYLKGTVNTRVV